MKKIGLYTILAFLCIYLFTSCDKDDLESQTLPDFKVEEIDKMLFNHINQANDLSARGALWKGYDFSKFPMYFVFQDKTGKAKRGYLVNPNGKVKEAIKLNKVDSKGINVYRYDGVMEKLSKLIKKGNGAYEMNVPINGGKYYGQVYDEKATKSDQTQPVMLAIHEVFHQFQFDWNQAAAIQDEKNYPLTKESLPLQIMTAQIAKKVPTITDKQELKKYLSMYVAIRSKEIDLDPSKDKLVTNMANWQENGEGTAKYVEYMLAQNIFKDYPKIFDADIIKDIKDSEQMRMYFAWGIWYGTGASVVYMLKNMGVDVEELVKDGKTLFSISEDLLKLTPKQKLEYLNLAKKEFNWKVIELEAIRLLEL